MSGDSSRTSRKSSFSASSIAARAATCTRATLVCHGRGSSIPLARAPNPFAKASHTHLHPSCTVRAPQSAAFGQTWHHNILCTKLDFTSATLHLSKPAPGPKPHSRASIHHPESATSRGSWWPGGASDLSGHLAFSVGTHPT